MDSEAPDRHVILSGGCNFRDMGGYPVRGGGSVKWRTLFRSGVLDQLTDADCATVAALGITTIIDLRANGERAKRPSRTVEGARTWARDYRMSKGDHSRPIAESTPQELHALMVTGYGLMLDEQADSYRQLFSTLAAAPGPVLFHCTGGKDRTGVGGAVLLDLLGVDREEIVADYLLTNPCLERDSGALEAISMQMPRELRIASPDYLAAMFARLDAEFDGAGGYLRHLGFGEDMAGELRRHYVEAP
ncbi:tyrosine-protein phosphatase [soil metagenome]